MGAPKGNVNAKGRRRGGQRERTLTALVVLLRTRLRLTPKAIQQRLQDDFGITLTVMSIRTRCWRRRRRDEL